jgi:hypothetical protein
MYNTQFGHEYLHSLVGTFVTLIQRKYLKKFDLNLCQSPDATPEDREKAIQQTRVVFEKFVEFLLGTAPHIPQEILEVAQSISRTVSDKFGERSGDTFLCGYFFLRFLCPSLASPTSTIRLDVSPNVQKFCILLSRILQASVNNQEFENENMKFANDMVRASQEHIGIFFSCLRRGSFADVEAIASASQRIRKEAKKYSHKCGKSDCGTQSVVPKDDAFRYFAEFFRQNTFPIRKKIKFESGYSRGDTTPLIVTTALANLKLLQVHFRSTEAPSSPGGVSSPLSKARDSPLSRLLHRSSPLVDDSLPSTPREYKGSPLSPDHGPLVLLSRKTSESKVTVVRKIHSGAAKDLRAVKAKSDTTQLHLQLGYE